MSSPERRRELARQRDEEDERRRRAAAARDEEFRYLPPSWRSLDNLAQAIGREHAELVKKLVGDLIDEARTDYNAG